MQKRILIAALLLGMTSTSAAQQITSAEYFFDADPGPGNATPVSIATPADTVALQLNLSVTGLSTGPHAFCLRTKDSQGTWSLQQSRIFYINAPQPLNQQVVQAEYFFDTDPGTGNGTPITILVSADTVTSQTPVSTAGLSSGQHVFCIRTIDLQGNWSFTQSRLFYHNPAPQAANQEVIQAEYFFDTDPGPGNGASVTIPQGDTVLSSVNITNPFASGSHYFVLRTRDADGNWSLQMAKKFNVCTTYGPKSIFDFTVDVNDVAFTNNSINAARHRWEWEGGQFDTLHINPSRSYALPGIYPAKLITYNSCASDTLNQAIQINGIVSNAPKIATPNALIIMDIKGFGFTNNSQFTLSRQGFSDIATDTFTVSSSGNLGKLRFKLNGAAAGYWNLVVSDIALHDTLYNAIEIDTATLPSQLEVQMRVSNRISRFRTNIFTISVTNKGNTPVYGIPVFIENTKASSTTLSLANPVYDNFLDSAALSLGTPTRFYYNIDSLTNDTNQIGAFLIPYIPAGETHFIQLKYRTTSFGTDYISVIVKNPLLDSTALSLVGLNRSMGNCTWMPPCLQAAFDIAGMVPGVGCVTGLFDLACAVGNYASDFDEGKPTGNTLMDLSLATGGTMISCLTGLPGRQTLRLLNSFSKITNTGSGQGPLLECWDDINGSGNTEGVSAFDPNLKLGLNGYNAQNYISDRGPISYTISFENADTASAPAAEVIILDTLDKTKFDLSTFRFDLFEIADSIYRLDLPSTRFVREIDLRPSKNTILRITGSLDTATGVLLSRFSSYDPDTLSIVLNPLDGFLPPNVSKPEGEGLVSFYCSLLPSVSNLDVVNNKAEIFFDQNAPIRTPVWFNTLDLNPPSSAAQPLSLAVSDSIFTVHWSGNDGESGVKHYNVYVSVNDNAYELWQANTSLDSGVFLGSNGVQYEFYSIAIDSVNNREEPPLDPETNPDASTTVVVGIHELSDNVFADINPNPASEAITIQIVATTATKCKATFYTMHGQQAGIFDLKSNEKKTIELSSFSPGMYYLRIENDKRQYLMRKIIVIK